MTTLNADNAANKATTPPSKNKANKSHGRIRFFESTAVIPATGMPAVGETIVWGDLPVGARFIGHLSQLRWSAGAASSTLNLGDTASPARHLAATAVTTAGSAVPEAAAANGVAGFETTDNLLGATDNCRLISTVAGATLQAGQVITLRAAYALD